MGVFTDRGGFGLNSQTTDQMALSIAFGHVGRMFGHRGAVAGLLLALASLVAMPMLGLPHQIGDSDHDPDCTYDYCHSPEFLVPAPTFQISDNIGQGQDVGLLPTATDADQGPGSPYKTMVYTLRDGDAPVADYDEDKPEYADGDAAAFYIYKDGSGQLKLRTALDHYETRVYRLKLVACDGNFRRGYIDVTVTVNDAAGERPLAPRPPRSWCAGRRRTTRAARRSPATTCSTGNREPKTGGTVPRSGPTPTPSFRVWTRTRSTRYRCGRRTRMATALGRCRAPGGPRLPGTTRPCSSRAPLPPAACPRISAGLRPRSGTSAGW